MRFHLWRQSSSGHSAFLFANAFHDRPAQYSFAAAVSLDSPDQPARYSSAIKNLGNAMRNKREELVLTSVLVVFMLVLSTSFMYAVENEVQPEAFSSIPSTLWWGVATLTTVGYGDIYPATPLGKKKKTTIICPHCKKEIVQH
ncbi:MAG: hypothetical protein GF398_14115 [Chitinivibrionales bacterium]|nr:hypothetical protein [Chitinivibrionales bacterium]